MYNFSGFLQMVLGDGEHKKGSIRCLGDMLPEYVFAQ